MNVFSSFADCFTCLNMTQCKTERSYRKIFLECSSCDCLHKYFSLLFFFNLLKHAGFAKLHLNSGIKGEGVGEELVCTDFITEKGHDIEMRIHLKEDFQRSLSWKTLMDGVVQAKSGKVGNKKSESKRSLHPALFSYFTLLALRNSAFFYGKSVFFCRTVSFKR